MSWPVNVSLQSVSGMLFEPEFTKHVDHFGGMMNTALGDFKRSVIFSISRARKAAWQTDLFYKSKCSQCFFFCALQIADVSDSSFVF